ncbi:MAG: glycoside hydrolase family 3 C-terminal domain-containing protein [Candidatus Promineofilum sp.]|nr:glycoside hydrolase family 3 C-terminal domain-containing protein [Promineifilum sp.]
MAIAQTADVALLYIALPSYKESEGYDRPDLDLTAQQVALIQAVTAVQPNTVVILNNGAPLAMGRGWISSAAAVMEGWMMGQAGGGAIADVPVRPRQPAGKLARPTVAPGGTPALQLPRRKTAWCVMAREGVVHRLPPLRRAKELPVRFPFGWLSYTTFAYDNMGVSDEEFRDVQGVMVSVDVTNTGAVPARRSCRSTCTTAGPAWCGPTRN